MMEEGGTEAIEVVEAAKMVQAAMEVVEEAKMVRAAMEEETVMLAIVVVVRVDAAATMEEMVVHNRRSHHTV